MRPLKNPSNATLLAAALFITQIAAGIPTRVCAQESTATQEAATEQSANAPAAAQTAAPAAAPKGKTAKAAATGKAANTSKTAAAGAVPGAGAAAAKPNSASQSIVALINDEPITVYEVEQRAAFIAISSGGGGGDMKAKAEARWKQIIKDPSTNTRFQELLKSKNVQTKEEARALQIKYVKELQSNMISQLQRETRTGAVAGSRGKAQDELIDEKIKMQEAKKLSVVASNEEVSLFIKSIADRNKMTEPQFSEHMKGLGVDIQTMRARFLAEISWREVIRRKFGSQIAITGHDVDKLVASTNGGEDEVALMLQRVSLFAPAKADQKTLAQRLGDAQAIAAKFTTCAEFKTLASGVAGARFEDLGSRKPSTIPEPTRTMLINTQDGSMLPPTVGTSGVELWAVCGRKVVTANETKRENAENELRGKEFELLAKKHLKDLRQDAAIEYR